ncbi:hypothetical protein [Hyalangium gracile]|uniref:hypothetical protein n=1 Tax=Hyalangium gracile TaxID=394092 RepID=UPI001CCD6BFB|nr:hypothetical protein [Hyalangium gracile]
MTERLHTLDCARRLAAATRARHEYRLLWPEACEQCKGAGGAWLKDLVTGRPAFEECTRCLAYSLCPRCASEESITGRTAPQCTECRWNLKTPGEPAAPACTCHPEASHG